MQSIPSTARRWLDSFVALPDRVRLPLALLLALLVHGAVVILVWLVPKILPVSGEIGSVKKPMEVTLEVSREEEKAWSQEEEKEIQQKFQALPVELQREYVDVEGLARKKNMSKRALLESWADSVAGTRKQGTSDSPLPSQDGREDLPFTNFKNQRAVVGDHKKPPQQEEAKTGVVSETPPSLFKPNPVEKNEMDQAAPEKIPQVAKVKVEEKAQIRADATTKPEKEIEDNLREVTQAAEDEIALFIKTSFVMSKAQLQPPPVLEPMRPLPAAMQPPKPEIKKEPPRETPRPETPRPSPSAIVASRPQDPLRPAPVKNPGYSPHLEMRKVDGGRGPLGESGVDSVATAKGRYVKSLNQAVGSRWTYYVRDSRQGSLIEEGSVTLKFIINAQGKIVRIQVVDNTSNAAHAALCERAFLEAQSDIEKPPGELLRNGVFEDTFTFTLL